jgi:hypothetical protein
MIKFLDLQKIKATLKKSSSLSKIYRIFRTIVSFIRTIVSFIKYHGISKKQLISFNKLLTDDISKMKILNLNNTILFYSPPIFDEIDGKPEMFEDKEYIQYVLYMNNATVLGNSNLIVTPSNKILYDLPFYDKLKRYRYTDSRIININKHKKVTYWRGKRKKIDRAIWMGGNYAWNYYHLVFEFAIKFHKLKELNIPLDVPVLIDQVCFEIPQYKELFDLINTKGYSLIPAEEMCQYNINDLYYINCPNFIPPNFVNNNDIRADDIQFDLDALCDFRKFLLTYSSNNNFPKKIFFIPEKCKWKTNF